MGAVRTRAGDLLRLVHNQPGITRAEAARMLGLGTGAATEVVGKLAAAGLIAEEPAPPTGGRGRPTTLLGPHPAGPLVMAVSITYESWRIRVFSVGGCVVASAGGDHQGREADAVVRTIVAAAGRLRQRLAGRVMGTGVSAPGIVLDGTLRQASYLGWDHIDLTAMGRPGEVFVAGNDATLAASAESHRGSAAGWKVALHLRVEAGLGGAVVNAGNTFVGATGVGGEFGHMPFGDPSIACPCGASGCWGTTVDGRALATLLRQPVPADPVAFFRLVIERAAAGEEQALKAVEVVAGSFGRGIAGLVNALDPDVVTVGGLGPLLLDVAPVRLDEAYRAGLMSFRRLTAPPVIATSLGEDGPLIGAAEETWALLWDQLVRL